MQIVNDEAPIDVAGALSAEARAAIDHGFRQERLLTQRAERRLKEHALLELRIRLALVVVLSLAGIALAFFGPPVVGGAMATWALARHRPTYAPPT